MEKQVIAIANQKGGVGKTTTAVNLCACLAEQGLKILLIDLDPQANATSGLGIEKQQGRSAYGPLLGDGQLADKIIKTQIERLELIPSEPDLAGAEVEIARSERYLRRFNQTLQPLRDQQRFDYIFVDCPPSLGILTSNVLTAANAIIIPVQCEYLAMEGLSMITSVVQQLRSGGANPALAKEEISLTMYDGRTKLAVQVVEEVRQHFGGQVYDTVIPRTVRLSEAPSFGQPVIIYDPRSVAATAYRALAREFLVRRNWDISEVGGVQSFAGKVEPLAESAQPPQVEAPQSISEAGEQPANI